MKQVVDAVAEQTPIPPHSVAWHSLPAEQVKNLLEVNEHVGLEATEVQARLARTGFNRLPEAARRLAWLRSAPERVDGPSGRYPNLRGFAQHSL